MINLAIPSRILTLLTASGALLLVLACASDSPEEAGQQAPDTAEAEAPEALDARSFERHFLFTTVETDSALVVPWFFTARAGREGVTREVRAWIVRNDTWESFHSDRWEDPPTRAPWRLLPRRPIRLQVGPGDAVETILYEEGGRELEIRIGSPLAEWGGLRGESARLLSATAVVSGGATEGLLLDLPRAWRAGDAPPGDWMLLTSGDSLQLFVEGAEEGESESPDQYSAWARLHFRDLRWPGVSVRWTERGAFERARRDIPVEWNLVSADGELEGDLAVTGSDLEAGAGEGPVRPVHALFQVEGSIRIGGGSYPVRGIVRHLQR